jgi:hypothetical protein
MLTALRALNSFRKASRSASSAICFRSVHDAATSPSFGVLQIWQSLRASLTAPLSVFHRAY